MLTESLLVFHRVLWPLIPNWLWRLRAEVQNGTEGRSWRWGQVVIRAERDYRMEQPSLCEKCGRWTFPPFSRVFPHCKGWKSSELHFPGARELLPPRRKQWGGSHTSVAPTISPGTAIESGLTILKDTSVLGVSYFRSMVLKAIHKSSAWCLHPPEEFCKHY